ncbi:MAG: 1-acyl-sn-glycerol-3-phosphate acyltransferase [Bacteroidales bacterium]|nr:1-acyl-sn-glycerol-3-phosphate acyltransferase [Bacteroidales bacterium]
MPILPESELAKLSPIFRGKAGNSFARLVRRIVAIDKLSDLHDRHSDLTGPAFAGAVLKDLGIDFRIAWSERLHSLPEGPFITISNHPYGGLDGVILVDLIGHQRPDLKVMVNEILDRIEALRQTWIVVNPKNDMQNEVTGRNIRGVKEVISQLREGHPVGFFPAGAISDLHLKDMKIRDREWQGAVVRLIQKARVPIVPVRFFDHNSLLFYNLGLIDWRIRLLRLPREVFNKMGRRIRVGIGETLQVEEQLKHQDLEDFRGWLRQSVYGMSFPGEHVWYKDFIKRTRH